MTRPNPETGQMEKKEYGPWMMSAFKLLAGLKGLRGGALDVFGRTAERRMERALIGEYETVITELLAGLDTENHGIAVRIAAIPDEIRGFGHVKAQNVEEAKARQAELLEAFRNPTASASAAE